MKKRLIFLSFLVMFLLSGCSKHPDENITFSGTYYYNDCIYLNPLSSATMGYATEKYKDIIYIQFLGNYIVYYDGNTENHFEDITYVKEEVDKDFDGLLSMGFEEVFQQFDERYDIYSEGKTVGLTIFVRDEKLYLADTDYIGGSKDVFTIWSVAEMANHVTEEICQKAEFDFALSGTYHLLTTTRCETFDYTFEYTTTFIDSPDVIREDIIIDIGTSSLMFTKCDVHEEYEFCKGEWVYLGEVFPQGIDVFSFKTMNLDRFQPIVEIERNEWLRDNYDLEYKPLDSPDIYIKLDNNKNVKKVFYVSFPSYEITYLAYEGIMRLPDEVIEILNNMSNTIS